MESLYIPQIVSVKVNLEASELDADYESKIKRKISDKYGDSCYYNGFIRKHSIEIVKIGSGYRLGSHLKGIMTFRVDFKADYCVPRKDKIIRCQIKTVNKFGALAKSYPMEVIIPRQIQQLDKNIDVFSNLNEGNYVNVKVLNYKIEEDKLIVVGLIVDLVLDKLNFKELPNDGLISYEYQMELKKAPKPLPDPRLGMNESLTLLKNRITPFTKVKVGSLVQNWWKDKVIYMISGYEMISPQSSKYGSIIKYDVNGKNGIRPVISRAYFKLWEVLAQLQLLDPWLNQPIQIANVAEGPGGFIQALLDYRDQQHNQSWIKDTYRAITLKKPGPKSDVLDWNLPKASAYFKKMQGLGYNLELGYGKPDGDGNLLDVNNIKYFVEQVIKVPSDPDKELQEGTCELVTGDGGVELKTDLNYELQEMANGKVFMAEIITALSVQKLGGTFILKIYDIYHTLTLKMIELLSIHYDKLSLIKPLTSRPANSEKYLVCQFFTGITKAKLHELYQVLAAWVPIEPNMNYSENKEVIVDFMTTAEKDSSSFLDSIVEFNDYNTTLQIEKLNEGLNLCINQDVNKASVQESYKSIQLELAQKWCEKYKVRYTGQGSSASSTSAPSQSQVYIETPLDMTYNMGSQNLIMAVKSFMNSPMGKLNKEIPFKLIRKFMDGTDWMKPEILIQFQTDADLYLYLQGLDQTKQNLVPESDQKTSEENDATDRAKRRAKEIQELLEHNKVVLAPESRYLDYGASDCKITGEVGRTLQVETWGADREHWLSHTNICIDKSVQYRYYLPNGLLSPEIPQVDLITAFVVFHHISSETIGEQVQDLLEHLKPGGYLAIREHDADTQLAVDNCHYEHALYDIVNHKSTPEEFFEGYVANYHSQQYWVTWLTTEFNLKLVEAQTPFGNTRYCYMLFQK